MSYFPTLAEYVMYSNVVAFLFCILAAVQKSKTKLHHLAKMKE